ncbi:MAG: single-stranded-DNA-specific exonuclease RecJ [Bacillota bacterium]|nr:single-stranded-DNA-specific exonuclease RecJ [Bacillota bacterium]
MIGNWKVQSCDMNDVLGLSEGLKISNVLAKLLINRGFANALDAEAFLQCSPLQLTDPFLLKGMREAVERIQKAIDAGEKIVVYGDYDVDGICSVVLLMECFASLHHPIDYYVPDRFSEGYGMNKAAVEKLAQQGYTLLITVDCGISSVEEVNLAHTLGMDVIITDHHTPAEVQPDAVAIVNPKNDNIQRVKDLAGVGVAFKLATALTVKVLPGSSSMQWLDLVTLATVADIVPLVYENRVLVKQGLEMLRNTSRKGLQALMKETNLIDCPIKSWHIGFVLGPRLNSAGRMQSARLAIELLLTTDSKEGTRLARLLCQLNEERKSVEDTIFREAVQQIEVNPSRQSDPVLVVDGDRWHEGVIGIVASRLAERFDRPTIVISWEENEGRGSARSRGGFNLYSALNHCSCALNGFGGHMMAAGLNMAREQFDSFYEMLQEYGKRNINAIEGSLLTMDMEIEENEMSLALWEELQCLEPFGEGNPVPLFLLQSAEINNVVRVGTEKQHFKCRVGQAGINAIQFRAGEGYDAVVMHRKFDLAVELDLNEFRGMQKLQLKIKDLYPAVPHCQYFAKRSSPYAWLQTVEQELEYSRPVLLVFSDYRQLTRYLPMVHHCFRERQIRLLHGQSLPWERMEVEQVFQRGGHQIFLSTVSYIQYYRKRFAFPNQLRKIFLMGKFDEEMVTGESGDKEIERIYQGQCVSLVRGEKERICNTGKTIVYCNLPGTRKKLVHDFPDALVEAGQVDFNERKRLRKQIINSEQRILISDGHHSGVLLPLSKEDTLILADCPFGRYEINGLTEGLQTDGSIPIEVIFAKNSVTFNRAYLEKIYPNSQRVKAVFDFLARKKQNTIQESIESLVEEMKVNFQQDFTSLELMSALHILADLGLCRYQKRGSIIAIKFMNIENQKLNIYDSPYFLEGMVEKSVFSEWEEELDQCQIW